MKKFILIFLGMFFVAIGSIGIIIPLLPTTPFLLLASVCFLKSSQKNYEWLINNKIYGRYIKDYIEHRRISFKAIALTLILLWFSIGYTFLFVVTALWIRIVLSIILVAVTLHILLMAKK
jgi:uncharacterized membrane protein YbaN (DUF454 family)